MIDQKQVNSLAEPFGRLAVIAIGLLSLVPGESGPQTGGPGPPDTLLRTLGTAGLLTFGYRKCCHRLPIVLCSSIYSAALVSHKFSFQGGMRLSPTLLLVPLGRLSALH